MRTLAVRSTQRCVNLRCTRDLLVPSQRSGQIRVEAATEQLQDDLAAMPAMPF